MKRLTSTLFILVSCLSIALLPACSKKDTAQNQTVATRSGGGAIFTNSVLRKIPEASVGFYAWSSNTPAYGDFKKTPWGKQSSAMWEQLSESFTGKDEKGAFLMKWLMSSGLLPKSAEQAPGVEEGAFFITANSPGVGLFLKGSKNVDLPSKLKDLRAALTKEGSNPVDHAAAGASGFKVPLEDASPTSPIKEIFCLANANYLGLASSSEHLQALFGGADTKTLTQIESSAGYKQAATQIQSDGQLAFGYLDVHRTVQEARKYVPQEDLKDAPITAAEIPFETLLLSRNLKGGLSDTVAVSVKGGTDAQKAWITSLREVSDTPAIKNTPKDVLVFLSLTGSTLRKFRDAVLKDLPVVQQVEMEKQAKVLDWVKDLGIGITNAPGGQLFPSLVLVANSDKPAELAGEMKSQISGMLQSSGLQMAPWQKKDVAGVPVDYFQTPLGVGAFIGKTDKGMLIGTSENVVRDAVKASVSGGEGGLLKSLPQSSQAMLADPSPIFSIYANLTGVADAIQTVQGNLAMFTGGQNQMDGQQIEEIRKMGVVLWSAKIQGDVLSLKSSYQQPTKKS